MKKLIICILFGILCFPSSVFAEELTVKADSALLVDAVSGEILWEKNAEEPMAPASLIKVLNILTANPYIEFSDDVVVGPLVETLYAGQLMNLNEGEIIEVQELLYGMMLWSANDAAVAMADYLVSDISFYAALMDKKAWALGAMNTVSINVNGYSDENQKTTVKDLAIIGEAFVKEPILMEFASTKNHTLTWLDPKKEMPLTNINRFLFSYQGATGLKTGTADMAGKCLMATAKREGRTLMAIVLNSSQRYEDCMKMMDFGFLQ